MTNDSRNDDAGPHADELQRLDLQDEDRLPWLEPADEEEEEQLSPLKLLGFIIGGLVVVGLIVGGLWWVQGRSGDGGQGTLIAAPAGDYKERPTAAEADARSFAGEGDASYAASEGLESTGRIDAARLPEAPVATTPAATAPATPAPATTPAPRVTARVSDATGQQGQARPATRSAEKSATIQLGAYVSQAIAQDAWKKLSKRFSNLGDLPTSIESAQVNGNTFYRLRATAASPADAAALCGRLKVAGENCLIVR